VEDVEKGVTGPLGRNLNYITKVRYPKRGGYESFALGLKVGADIRYEVRVDNIDLGARKLRFSDGSVHRYERLVSTIPLPIFIGLCAETPIEVKEAAAALSCTQLLLVNITGRQTTCRKETWFYVYDEDKLATRISFTERLTRGNALPNTTGIQTEIYASRRRPLPDSPSNIARRVKDELIQMGLLDPLTELGVETLSVPWANVIFTHETKAALNIIWSWLERYGLVREIDDTDPLTDWSRNRLGESKRLGSIVFAGRYAQWKYFWTDDCVLRGKHISEN
jgi:protoporphyrinogen oxidase